MRNTPPEVRVEAGGHALHVQAGPHAPDGSRDLGPTVARPLFRWLRVRPPL
jgi:hypothetical protein